MKLLDHFCRFGWPRRALFALGLLLVLAVVVRVLLDPIAAHFTRRGLSKSVAMSLQAGDQPIRERFFRICAPP